MQTAVTIKKNHEPRTGIVVPVSALQTNESLGCGEFLDLIPFADLCQKSNLSLIQILPINDTGTESSPYSALSAFALHPIYIRISKLKEFSNISPQLQNTIQEEIEKKKAEYAKEKRFNYKELRYFKLSLLKKIWLEISPSFIESEETKIWIKENSWIQSYACFMVLKEQNMESFFKEWKEFSYLNKAEILELWDFVLPKESLYFYLWLQKNASEQLKTASEYCQSKDVFLKGDIPILMNEDSADIWEKPEFFMDTLRAGSPPDGTNPFGQNWGFPIYNWDSLKKENYSWWKERLHEASKYFQMYRIDHILGFFRIWAIPQGESKAVVAWTIPQAAISRNELLKCTLSKETIQWLSKPHIPTYEIQAVYNNDYLATHGVLATCMDRIGTEELWLFKDSIKTDADIWNLDIPQTIKEKLAEKWLDRCFIEIKKDSFVPRISYENTSSWKSLSEGQRYHLLALFKEKTAQQDKLWESQAKEILGTFQAETEMIACAEDLGIQLESMPRVLSALSIYALRVVRWNRFWEKEGKPFVPFSEYPVLSVTTSSVHDSSTLRQWWDEEPDAKDFGQAFLKTKDDENYKHKTFSPELCYDILSCMAKSKSNYFIIPIQDFLSLDEKYYDENSENERINIPGTVNDFNWTYKIPVFIDELEKNTELVQKIQSLVAIRELR